MQLAMKKNKGSGSPYTEDWLPIKDIQNGMILTTTKQFVTGVKITPRNIFILDNDMQNHVLISLKNFYNMLDFEFWLVVSDIEKGKSFINNNVVDTEYYLLFKEKDINEAQKKIRLMINGLASCGLNASQTTNDDLRVVLNNFLNGGRDTGFGVVMPA